VTVCWSKQPGGAKSCAWNPATHLSTSQYTSGKPWKKPCCTINGIDSVTQYGAAAALNGTQDATRSMAQEYQLRRDILFDALEGSPYVKAFKPHGTFYM
jgi:hypothetical protein